MAIEYIFYSAADLVSGDLRDVVVGALDGSVDGAGHVVRPGLSSFAYRVEADDEAGMAEFYGIHHRVTVSFRFTNNARELDEHNTALMIGLVLGVNDRTGADGVLLFNGEEAVILCRGGEATFAAQWAEWDDLPEVVALRSGRRVASVD